MRDVATPESLKGGVFRGGGRSTIGRIPFQNTIYVADGPRNNPCFSLIDHFGGNTFAVYKPKSEAEFKKAYEFQNSTGSKLSEKRIANTAHRRPCGCSGSSEKSLSE
jgi:hypothetical protein